MNVYVGTKLRRKSDGLICECVSLIRDGMIEVRHGKNGVLLAGGGSHYYQTPVILMLNCLRCGNENRPRTKRTATCSALPS